MKHLALTALALILAISLCACNGAEQNPVISTAPVPTTAVTSPASTTAAESDPGPGDPGDTEDPAWWGEYTCADTNFSVGISNYDSKSFRFNFSNLRNGEYFYDGAAAISADDNFTAEYGELSFTLSEDFNAIDISAPEGAQWAHLGGRYERIFDSFDTSHTT